MASPQYKPDSYLESSKGIVPLNGPTDAQPQRPVSKFRLRLWIGFCISFIILAPLVSIVLGITQQSRQMEYPQARRGGFEGRTIALEIVFVAADPKDGSMKLDWRILRDENSPCTADNLDACTDVNLFFDTNLFHPDGILGGDSDEPLSNSPPEKPVFVFNARNFLQWNARARVPAFRTQLAIFSPPDQRASLSYYPFDKYTTDIALYALEVGTNATVGTKIAATRGTAVGFEIEVTNRQDRDIPSGLTSILVHLKRSKLIQSYSVIATIAIWIVTLILVLVMVSSVVFSYRQRPEVLLIPVATLFAFTTLRQSMPGAPEGFGDIIDLAGLVPCLALLSLTTACSLGIFLFSDPAEVPQQLRWEDLRRAIHRETRPVQ